jgi:exosortase
VTAFFSTMREPTSPGTMAFWLVPFLVAALWVPAMIAASYGWRHGEYYDYGWFVPPAALWLLIRRWKEDGGPAVMPDRRLLLALLLLVPWFLALRILGHADPSWRLPMVLLAMTAAVVGHGLIAASRGWRFSARFVWITLLALSAIPWPSVVEQRIVENLTDGVIHTVAEWFQISGRPVEIVGDRLRLHELTVEVTDGCSGVRSFQSFVMATWFFAELQRMRATRVMLLLAFACGAAFVVNTVRTWALATIRFDHGVEAFERAHDWLGLLAFVASAVFFYSLSGWLSAAPRRRMLRTVVAGRTSNVECRTSKIVD